MLFFPQLTTGCLMQYPSKKAIRTRTVFNRAAGGDEVKRYDSNAGSTVWDLSFAGLSSEECVALDTFFAETEGRLKAFTWLDPTSNLLAWSEDFTNSCWQNSGLLQFAPGRPDPFGGSSAVQVSNSGQDVQPLQQSLAAPGRYAYCLSTWIRSDAPTSAALFVETANSTTRRTFAAGDKWARLSISVEPGPPDELLHFGVELPAAATIDLFGAQAEPQPMPGEYIKTTARSGVYLEARFDQDVLVIGASAPNCFDVGVRIVAGRQG